MSDQASTPQGTNGTGAEAPASATVKYELTGYEVLFTMRDANAHALATKRVPALLKLLSEQGATPCKSWGGNKSNGKEKHICPVHQVEMQLFEKEGRKWYSHKAVDPQTDDEYWCKGKPQGVKE